MPSLSISHTFVSSLPDNPVDIAVGKVVPTNWNSQHAASAVGGRDGTKLETQASITPRPLPIGSRTWGQLISNFNGSVMFATDSGVQNVVDGGYIYRSTDFGVTWTALTAAGSRLWYPIAMSADAQIIYAGDQGTAHNDGKIYKSSDGGDTWSVLSNSIGNDWGKIVCSADGQRIFAKGGITAQINTVIQRSIDGGATWSAMPTDPGNPTHGCYDFDMSADGLIAYTTGGWNSVTKTVDGGDTWINNLLFAADTIVCSSDGQQVMSASGSSIYYSNDGWATQTSRGNILDAVSCLDSSDNFGVLVVSQNSNAPAPGVYISTDLGVSWSFLFNDAGGYFVNFGAFVSGDGNYVGGVSGGGAFFYIGPVIGSIWLGQRSNLAWKYDGGWVDIRDWGAIGDGVTDSSAAFNAFNAWARLQTGGVNLILPPGNYINTTAGNFWVGIQHIVIWAYGATVSSFGGGQGFMQVANTSARINSTQPGDISVTLKTLSDASFFTAGDWVCIASESMQRNGYPPNHFNFEYRQINSINALTGVIDFFGFFGEDTRLKYRHLDTYPLSGTVGGGDSGGPATIHLMHPDWDQQLFVYGLELTMLTGTNWAARHIEFHDVVMGPCPSISPTNSKHFLMNGCQWYFGEFDKDIEYLFLKSCSFYEVVLQSASITNLIIDGCNCAQSLHGVVRNLVVRDSFLQTLQLGAHYGHNRTVTLDNCQINNFTMNLGDAFLPLPGASFSNGTFAVSKVGIPIYIDDFFQIAQVGARCQFAGTDANMPPPFVVLDVREDVNNYYMDTTAYAIPTFSGVGAPATDSIFVHPAPSITATNCYGCPAIAELSKARKDRPLAEYGYRTAMSLPFGQVNAKSIMLWGTMVKIRVNVIRAYTGANVLFDFNLSFYYYDTAGQRFLVNPDVFNTKNVGERIYTPGAVSGAQPGDTMTTIPAGAWISGSQGLGIAYWFSGDATIVAQPLNQWPIVELETFTDQGAITNLGSLEYITQTLW